jgi:hypothetical protein
MVGRDLAESRISRFLGTSAFSLIRSRLRASPPILSIALPIALWVS